MKTATATLIVGLVATSSPASAQTCYTPIASWQVTYKLSGNSTADACIDGNSAATCSTALSATGTDSYTLPIAVSCSGLEWGLTVYGTVTSASVNNFEKYQCAVKPPTEQTITAVGSGPFSSNPAFAQTLFNINGDGTYSFEPFPDGADTLTWAGCDNSSVPDGFPLYPSTNWPQTFSLPTEIQPLQVTNFPFSADGGFNLGVSWHFSFDLTPTYLSANDCHKNGGSSVGCLNQSLGEDVAIAGTPFHLHYESGRTGGNGVVAIAASLIGGWTFDVVHAYDASSNTLFLGDGSLRNGQELGAPVSVGGNLLLTSEDGGTVYVVTPAGMPTATLKPMTGAPEYQFGYDTIGELISITDASGNVTTIQRDASEQPTAIVGPFGQTTTVIIDSNGFLSQITDPLGLSQSFSYSSTGLLTSRRDANGNVFTYTYDGNGRLTKDADPLGGFVAATRTDASSGFGYTVGQTTSMGRTSTFQNTLNLPWVQDGTVPSSEQHNNTWPNGLKAQTSSTFQKGQLLNTVTLPDGTSRSETLGPDPRWGLQSPVPLSATLTKGSLAMTTTGTRSVTLGTAGDPFSLTSEADTLSINGRKYSAAFTTANLTWLSTTPANRKTTTILDTLERTSSVQIGSLTAVALSYDSRGHLTAVTQATRKTSLTYNTSGFLADVTDPLGLQTGFSYDADGRLLTKTLPDGRAINYTYDANGNLTSVTPPGKSAHLFAYTAVDRPSAYTPPTASGTGPTSYSYDLDRNLTTVTRPDGATIHYGYDSAGRLNAVTTPSEAIAYSYDTTTGNVSGAAISGGEAIAYGYNGPLPTSSTWSGTVAGRVSRTFNNNFWVASQSLNGANTMNFTYDKDGFITKAGALAVAHNANGLLTSATLGSAATGSALDSHGYSAFGELTSYAAKYKIGTTTTTLYSEKYTRDADGRISAKTETVGSLKTTYTYTYDKAGRLTAVKKNGASLSSYTYDSNSNRTSATTASGTVNGTYDAQDRLLTYGNTSSSTSYTYTANGELASQAVGTHTTTYTYDVLGNLIGVTLPSGTVMTYLIDPENHRVGTLINGVLQAGFLYDDQDRVVAQLNAANQIVSQFVYGTDSTSPDYMVQGGITYRIFPDQLGSPRLIVNTATGAVIEQIDYDEFGVVTNDTNPGFQPFGFAGGLYDQQTKLVRFGARDYNPTIGRWTAKDPVLFHGMDTNLYEYAMGDPVNLQDPSGHGLADTISNLIYPIWHWIKHRHDCKACEVGDGTTGQEEGDGVIEGKGITGKQIAEHVATETAVHVAGAIVGEHGETVIGEAMGEGLGVGITAVGGEEQLGKGVIIESQYFRMLRKKQEEADQCEKR
jgi:RHS repeat-associated protein